MSKNFLPNTQTALFRAKPFVQTQSSSDEGFNGFTDEDILRRNLLFKAKSLVQTPSTSSDEDNSTLCSTKKKSRHGKSKLKHVKTRRRRRHDFLVGKSLEEFSTSVLPSYLDVAKVYLYEEDLLNKGQVRKNDLKMI